MYLYRESVAIMVLRKDDQCRLRQLLSEAIPLLCRNGISFNDQFSIEALIGITVDEEEVLLVSVRETIKNGEYNEKKTPNAADHEELRSSQPRTAKRKSESNESVQQPINYICDDASQVMTGHVQVTNPTLVKPNPTTETKHIHLPKAAEQTNSTQTYPSPPNKRKRQAVPVDCVDLTDIDVKEEYPTVKEKSDRREERLPWFGKTITSPCTNTPGSHRNTITSAAMNSGQGVGQTGMGAPATQLTRPIRQEPHKSNPVTSNNQV